MKKNLIVVSVLALALILSPLSGIGAGVSAGEENTPAAVSSVSGNQGSVSGGDVTQTPAPTDPTQTPDPGSVSGGDVTPTPAPTDPTQTPAPTDPTQTPVPADPTQTPDPVVDKLDSILDNTEGLAPDKVVETLLNAVDHDTITIGKAMKDSDDFRSKVAALEKDYASQKNITVADPEVSDAAKEYVDAGRVSVVGAAFNAGQGETVNLHMDRAEKPADPDFGENKVVSLDIKLYANGSSVRGNMDMPVTITMPVPGGLNVGKLVIRHYADLTIMYDQIDFKNNGDGTITFSVDNFSTFAFIEVASSGDSGNSAPSKKGGSNSSAQGALESQIAAAAPGTVIKITKDQNINTLSNSVMKQLVKRGDVALEMEYTYNGVDYHIVIPAGMAEDNDIPWYGPLYLSAYYSNYAVGADAVTPVSSIYVVQRGDTLSRIARRNNTTVAKLAVKNPQIKNINRIMPGQIITIE